jgi:Ca-activated chloride channel family protein
MTDGYVGNDMEIVPEIQRHPNARVFSFGIGSSVNRFLLDKMAEQGRGEVEYVGLNEDGSAAAKRFHERVRSPLLTDISVDWGGLPVADVYPKRIPDLFAAKPVVLHGRYTAAWKGAIHLRGKLAGKPYSRDLTVTLPAKEPAHDVLASLWARAKINDLMAQDYNGIQMGTVQDKLKDAIAQLGLDFRLMTQYTSFVAVEEMTVTEGGEPRRVEVPVEMPEGVSYEGVFGSERAMYKAASVSGGGGSGVAAGVPGGVVGGIIGARPMAAPPPPSVAMSRIAVMEDRARVLSLAEQKMAKLHPSLAAMVERLKNPAARPRPEEAQVVRNGKAEVQIFLTDTSAETLAKLKQLGFELVLQPKTAKIVIGRIPIEKLAALADLSFVKYVAPQPR